MFSDDHIRPGASRPHGEAVRAMATASSPKPRAADARLDDFPDGRPTPARAVARAAADDKLSDFLGSKPTATATAVRASDVSVPARSAVGIASSGLSAADAKLAQFLGGKPGSPAASPPLQPTAAASFPASDVKLADFRRSQRAQASPELQPTAAAGSPASDATVADFWGGKAAPAKSTHARSAATGSGLGALEAAVIGVASDVRRAFERRDADLDGKLSMPEVTAALADLRLDVEPRRLRMAFIDLDTDQDFKLRAPEFAQLVSQLQSDSAPAAAGRLPSGAGWRDALPEWTACAGDLPVGTVDLAPDFTVEFELMLDRAPASDWGSVLRISSTRGDRGAYGDRLLAILTHPGSHRLHVVCGTPRDPDASCDTAEALTPGVAHTVKVAVAGASCTVLVDGRRVASKTGLSNRTRQPGARVLATDGFGGVARARVRNVSVQSVEATQPLRALLDSAGSATTTDPASAVSSVPTSAELTTGLAEWRQTRSHGSFPAGKAPTTSPHAAWFRPAPRDGAWLGSSSSWPIGEVTFELEFQVSAPEAAHFALEYAVDNALQRASLNGLPLDIGRAQGCRHCGGEATIWAPQGEGLFVKGANVLSVTVANSGTTANPMGLYATGRAVTGFTFDHTDALASRQWAEQHGWLAGGGGLNFVGKYDTKGLFAYKAGRYAKMAFFGTGGTVAQMSAPPSNADEHRPHWGRGSHKPVSPLSGSPRSVLPAAPSVAETRRAFSDFDTNRSGQLDFRELRQALAKLGLPSDSSTVLDTMRSFDADASGTLSFPEFEKLVALIVRPSKPQQSIPAAPSMAETRRAFSDFDTNRSGQLDFRELRQALAKLGLPSDSSTVLDTMRSFDADASGTLSFPEFEKLVGLIVRPPKPQQSIPAAPSLAETRRAFSDFDTNRSGQLDFRELRQALAKLGLPSDSSTVLDTMRSFDADASGTLSFPEFEKLVGLIVRPPKPRQAIPAAPSLAETRRAFSDFDTNRSGQLDFRELRQALAKLGLPSDSSTVLDTMRSFDADASGTLSFPEFEKLVGLIVRPPKPQQAIPAAPSLAETRRAFSDFDTNRSGQLDFRELRQALAKLGLPSDSSTVLDTMRSFDADASGTLSFPEFEKLVGLIVRPPKPQQSIPAAPSLAETRRAFSDFDTNRSGQLDFRELRQALAKLGLPSDSSTVLDTMRSFDADASGTLSFPEFEKLVGLIVRPPKPQQSIPAAPSLAETRRAFSDFDTNRSGQLDFRELRQALAKLGLPSDSSTVLDTMRSFDADASGTLSFPEFEKLVGLIVRPPKPQQSIPAAPSLAETRRAFSDFDTNRSGQLDFRELRQALAKLGLPSDSSTVLDTMRSFDADASGTLSFTEFEKLVALIGEWSARHPSSQLQDDKRARPTLPASSSTIPSTRRTAMARLEPLLSSALDATLVEQPAEHDVLRFFTRNVASLAYGGDAAIAAQEQRLGRSLDGTSVDDYLRRVRRTLEGAIQDAVASCVAEMAAEHGAAASRDATGSLLSGSGLGAAKTDARMRIIPWLERIVERSSRRESDEERRRREAEDARRKAEAAAQANEIDAARRRASELASSPLIFDEEGGIHIARDFNSDGAARLSATRRCRMALEGGTGAAPSVQAALVGGGHVARLAGWAMGASDPRLMREAAWVLALLQNEGGTAHREAVANEPLAAAALVSALAAPVGDAEGDRAAAAAAQALCKLVTASTAARDAALARGVLSPLIERAHRFPSSQAAPRLLSRLARGKPMVRLSLIAEALPTLCQLTASADTETATDACWAVASLLDGHDQHVQAVLAAAPELPRRLVEVLGRPEAGAAAAAAARPPVVPPEVLRVFHRFDQNSSGALSRSELRVALGALGLDTSRAEAAALVREFDANGNGTLSPAEFSRLAARLGFGPAVAFAAGGAGSGRDSGMLTPSVRALSSICACGDALTQAVIDNAGLPALTRLIDCPLADVRKEALLALSNVAAGSAEQVSALLGAGVFAPLAERMAEGERGFNKEAVWTLANATASGDTDTLLAIARTSSAVAALVQMVGDDDPKLVEVALDGLDSLLMAGAGSVVHPSVKRVFDRFDTNKTGRLSRSELQQALIDLGLDLSRKQAAAILRQYDADGDGTLSPPEFAVLATRLGAPRGGTNPVSSQMKGADAERVLRALEASRRSGDAGDALTEKATRVLDLCRAGMDI